MVDLLFSVSPISVLLEGMVFISPSSLRVVQFEGPQEVVGFLEMFLASADFLDQVLNTGNAELAQVLINDGVIAEGDSSSVHFAESSGVNEFRDDLSAGVAEGDEGLDSLQHGEGGLVDLDEDAIVKLSQSEELKDFFDLGVHLVDTLGSDDEGDLGFGGHEEVAVVSGVSLLSDEGGF